MNEYEINEEELDEELMEESEDNEEEEPDYNIENDDDEDDEDEDEDEDDEESDSYEEDVDYNAVNMYLKTASNPNYTKEEELELFELFNKGQLAENKLKDTNLTQEEIDSLKDIVRKGQKAYEKLYESKRLLVVSEAKKFKRKYKSLKLEYLISQGDEGLIHSIITYDPSKGASLSTYATTWIKQKIYKAGQEKGRLIKLPASVTNKINKMNKAIRLLNQELHRKPTDEELIEKLNKMENEKKDLNSKYQKTNFDLDLIKELRMYNTKIGSLDNSNGDDNDDKDEELIGVVRDNSLSPVESKKLQDEKDELYHILRDMLTDNELEVIYHVVDFNKNGITLPNDEIAKLLNITEKEVE